ncbi:methyltransferase domain-containing protein [Epidermidibacterium keratini]|uniref:Methyltransferase domain-containing protein n=1 Tax=Epidermidibacterium keratini TaxID=1891644 RepID=A0A7L4YL46_9ACTN|nr:class I SAM-dependent methyltransferase [Epidermidibacterium keratini]QHB99563.1 methyltransferase domain-containing protein [Epidermidibacterium keratini]
MTSRWQELTGGASGERYAAAMAARAKTGADMHGEASFVADRIAAPARILDAGCGTGRVGIRLAELGYDVGGVDLDESMLAVARRTAPHIDWVRSDLAEYADPDGFDAIICAGNVIPLLADGALDTTMRQLASQSRPNGTAIFGFGLDAAHLPAGCDPTPLADFDAATELAGLQTVERYASWDGAAYSPDAGYAVTVSKRIR